MSSDSSEPHDGERPTTSAEADPAVAWADPSPPRPMTFETPRPDPPPSDERSWLKDRDFRFVRANAALARSVGTSPRDVVGRSDDAFWPSRFTERFRRDDALAAGSGKLLLFEPGADGGPERWLVIKVAERRGGEVVGVSGLARAWTPEALHWGLGIPEPTPPGSVPGWIEELERVARDRFRKRLLVRALARRAGRSPSDVGRQFLRRVGVSLPALVRRLRIAWALERIVEGEPLGRIALQAGFADQSHFTRIFKREVGLPPGAFRARVE